MAQASLVDANQVYFNAVRNGATKPSSAVAISDVDGLQSALDGKAASAHTHEIADVNGLQAALDSKQDAA
ncbi:hypothetical protein NPJ88_000470 [Halomonas elongata]|uniref:hypothetical protein n=1 Tax=Halomonas elongata TaxID=2746 RepID=UPI00255AC17E|nr:hypothetical protein [Halomonas elongata]MDL4860797.1 hypothetical protein [Halomonas elongata]